MKKLVLALIAVALISTPVFAVLDDNSTNQTQGQIGINDNENRNANLQDQDQGQLQGQQQGQGQAQGQGQMQGQAAIAAQGQLGIVGQAAVNKQETTINQEGDDITTAVWPTTPSTSSKEEKSIYSLFGGIGSNKTEEQIRLQNQMQITEKLYKDGIIQEAAYRQDMLKAYQQLLKSNKGQKLLGILPIAERGCSIVNACGLLVW